MDGAPEIAAVVEHFDRVIHIPIIAAAILPLIVVSESGNWVGELVGVVSWLVFLVDYVVNERRLVRYTSTWLGRFDVAVVVLTAPGSSCRGPAMGASLWHSVWCGSRELSLPPLGDVASWSASGELAWSHWES